MTFFITLTSIWAMSIFNVNCVQTSCTQTASPQASWRLSSPAFSTVSFMSSHLLVPPASFQLLHVSHPSIFSLFVLSSSSSCASIIPFSNPSDRITCPKNPNFLLSAVCCSVSSSSTPISMRTLSLVFFSVLDILCIFLQIHISHALIFFSIFFVIVHISQPYRTVGKISVLTTLFSCLCSRVCLTITFLIQSL